MVTPSPHRYASIEDLLATWLKTVVGYENVVHEPPTNLVFVMPLVVVDRIGGADNTITLDVANVDIDVFAPTRADAIAHGEHIRQELRTKLRGWTSDDVTFGQPKTISAPKIIPYDSRNTVRRSTASYQIPAHQYTGIS